MLRRWEPIARWAVVLGVLFLLGRQAWRHGTHWRLDDSWTPVPIEGSVPGHHPDGTPINPVDRQLEATGLRPAFYHAIYLILGVGLAVILLAAFQYFPLANATNELKAMLHFRAHLPPELQPRWAELWEVGKAQSRAAKAARRAAWLRRGAPWFFWKSKQSP